MKFLNKYLFLMTGILATVFPASGNNMITISEVEGAPGEEVSVSVNLKSTDEISALQLSFPLDNSATVVSGSGQVSGRASSHSVSCGTKDNVANLMLYSTGMNAIPAGDGEIAEFKLKLGDIPMSLSPIVSVKATDRNGNEISCSSNSFGLHILGALADYPQGVAYDFGHVPLRDSYSINIPIANNGGSRLVITDLEFSSPEFKTKSALPFNVEAGNMSNLEIGYTPQDRGSVSESVRIISNSYSPNNVLKLLADPYSVNEIIIQDVSGISDSEVDVRISMNNMDEITGFTLEFELPAELEYVPGSFVLTDRKKDHQVSASYSDSKLKATAYSLSNSAFKNEEGDIASFKMKLNGRNGASLQPSKAVLSALVKGKVEDVTSAVYPGQISVNYPYLYASSSLSLGRTPITESVSVPFAVYNYGSAPLIIEKYVVEGVNLDVRNEFPIEIPTGVGSEIILDLNGSFEGELEGILQLYSNDPENRMFNIALSGERYAPNSLSLIGGRVLNISEQGILSISLDNYDEISGFQFDVRYPSRFEPMEPALTERTKGFSVSYNKMGNDVVRYMCYSLSGNSIEAGAGNVFELPFSFKADQPEGSYQFVMSNVKLSTPEGVNKSSVIDNPSALITIVPYVAVESISLDKTEYEGNPNTTLLLSASINPSNATEQNISWTSSNPQVAKVDGNGLASLLSLGSAVITATCEGKSATCSINVVPLVIPVESVVLNAENIEMRLGDEVTLTATIKPADATDLTLIWESSNERIVTVLNGKLTAVGVGEAEVTVKASNNKSATVSVAVKPIMAESIILNQTSFTGRPGDTLQLTATVSPSNTTDKTVTWTSSDINVATVDNSGLVSLKAAGTATITATAGNKSATCKITVIPYTVEVTSITLDKSNIEVKEGETATLTATIHPDNATDKNVTWSSSDSKIASITNGVVTGISVGTATITATSSNGKKANCIVSVISDGPVIVEVTSISLISKEVTMKEGDVYTLTATVYPENATDKTVKWISSDPEIVSVNNGVVTGLNPGEAIVTASTSNGISASCNFIITEQPVEIVYVERIELSEMEVSGEIGTEIVLIATVYPENATNKNVVWRSSDETIVTVSLSGVLKIINEGTGLIIAEAEDGSGVKAECKVNGLAGIESILANPESKISVYSPDGILIKKDCNVEELKTLSKGIYIIVSGKERYKISI